MIGPGLGLDLARRSGAMPWWRAPAYLLDGRSPTLALDFVRGRAMRGDVAKAVGDLVSVSSGAKWVATSSGALEQVPANTAAFDHGSGRRRLLVEGAATNLIGFSHPAQWTYAASATYEDGPAGPDGALAWIKVIDASTMEVGTAQRSFSVSANTSAYAFSLFLMKDAAAVSGAQVRVTFSGGTSQEYRVAVNPITGGVGSVLGSPIAVYAVDLGSCVRIVVVAANNGTNTAASLIYMPAVQPDPASASTSTSATTTGWGYIFWGQVETGQRATSPIRADGAQVSRIADVVALNPTALAAFDNAKGTAVFRGNTGWRSAQARLIRAAAPGAQPAVLAQNANDAVVIGGATSGALTIKASASADIGAAAGWSAAGRAGAVNGDATVADAAAMAFEFSAVNLGGNAGPPSGTALLIDEIVAWSERGSDAALRAQARGWQ